jgi:hypothetical protein
VNAPRSDATIGRPDWSATVSVYAYVSGTWAANRSTSACSAASSCASFASSYWPTIDSGTSETADRLSGRAEHAKRQRSPRLCASSAHAATTFRPLARRQVAEHHHARDPRLCIRRGFRMRPHVDFELGEIAADAGRHVVRRRDQALGGRAGSVRTCRATVDVETPLRGTAGQARSAADASGSPQ